MSTSWSSKAQHQRPEDGPPTWIVVTILSLMILAVLGVEFFG